MPKLRLSLCVLLLCAALGSACGADSASSRGAVADQLPRKLQLPAPSQLARQAAFADTERQIHGADYDAALPFSNVQTEGDDGLLWSVYDPAAPVLDDASYAVYAWTLDGYSGAPTINLDWTTPPATGELWLGLASFSQDRWVWVQPGSMDSYSFDSNSDYFGPAGQFYAVVLVLSTFETRLASLRIGDPIGPPQQPPVAVLTADYLSGAPPLDVSFNTNASYDPDGPIVLYEVDNNDDGTYEESSTEEPLMWSQRFSTEGQFIVRLRVTDNDGLTDTDQLTIVTGASSGWVGVIIPGVTQPSSPVWDAGGLPLVTYSQGVYLSCIRAQNTLGQAWDNPLDIYFTGNAGAPCAALINGLPAVAYETVGGDGFSLSFVIANDAAGTSWGDPVFVAKGPAMMQNSGDPRLMDYCGYPAIVYQSDAAGARALYWYWAKDANGTSWNEGVDIGPDNVVGASQPRVIGGMPAAAYVWRNEAESRYEYAYSRAAAADGSAWGPVVQLLAMASGSPGDVSYGIDLIDAGGAPAVAYCSYAIPSGAKQVSFLRANDSTGDSWPAGATAIYTTSGEFDFVKWPVLSLIAGTPAVAVQEWSPDTFGRIVYCRAQMPDCEYWNAVEEVTRVDSGVLHDYEPFARWLSLGMSGGLPAITCLGESTEGNQSLFLTRR